MSRAIRLVELRVENVGTLRGPIQLGPFAPGVNVISGSNEAGKRHGLFLPVQAGDRITHADAAG